MYGLMIPSFAWQVEVFGSFRTVLYLPTSDIDVNIFLSFSFLSFLPLHFTGAVEHNAYFVRHYYYLSYYGNELKYLAMPL
jgi:hypothetical protein